MHDPPFEDEWAIHRWFAMECNNRAWDLLESASRSVDESEQMVHTAHAACYHWLHVGTAVHQARAPCLLANVYAELGDGPSALRHAERCMRIMESQAQEMADWDHAFGHDCLARSKAAAGMVDDARRLKAKARELADAIDDPHDRQIFNRWFASGNWHGID